MTQVVSHKGIFLGLFLCVSVLVGNDGKYGQQKSTNLSGILGLLFLIRKFRVFQVICIRL